MPYKDTPLRLKRIEAAKKLGLDQDFSEVSTKAIYNMIERHNKQNREVAVGVPDNGPPVPPVNVVQTEPVEEKKVEDNKVENDDAGIDISDDENGDEYKYDQNIVSLKCVKVGSKLRIRFHSFRDRKGKVYTNIYNNNYNCRFPKDIRQEGYFYEIPDTDIALNKSNTAPFYVIGKHNIKIIKPDAGAILKNLKIYEISECVICCDADSNNVFLPCGHLCTCVDCSKGMKDVGLDYKCPICRRDIIDTIVK